MREDEVTTMVAAGPILAVDDDDSIRDIVQIVLEDGGYGVVLARDGAEALEMLKVMQPELILLDMRMPRVNGWEFAEQYGKFPGPHAPIIVMTAGRDAKMAASDIGAKCHLDKPFDVDDLLHVVEECISSDTSRRPSQDAA